MSDYPAHQSSDEGTCWCPAAEQAGRERDRYRTALRHIADAGPGYAKPAHRLVAAARAALGDHDAKEGTA